MLHFMLAKSLAPSAFFEQFCSMGLYTCTRVCVLANSNVQSTRVPGNLSYVRLRHTCDLDRHHHLVGQLVVRSHFPIDHTTVGLAQTHSNNYTHVLATKSWPTQDRFLQLHSQTVSVEEVFRPLHCGVKQIYTIAAHRQTVALMVSYDLILCDFCGVDVYREFFGKPNSSPNEVRCAEQLPVSAATSSSAAVFE